MNLSNMYDAVNQAIAEAQTIAQQMDSLLGAGDLEGAQALADAFDQAEKRVNDFEAMYKKASGIMARNVAAAFVAPATASKTDESSQAPIVSRAAYDAMGAKERQSFIFDKAGVVVDELEAN